MEGLWSGVNNGKDCSTSSENVYTILNHLFFKIGTLIKIYICTTQQASMVQAVFTIFDKAIQVYITIEYNLLCIFLKPFIPCFKYIYIQ